MKNLFLLLTFSLFTSSSALSFDQKAKYEVANYLNKNKEAVLKVAKEMYEYTYYEFKISSENCIGKKSPIGAVGMCLVKGLANEENAIAYFSVNLTSDYSGTGDKERKITLTLIDYEI
tara:strand:- start:1115 stop:1468 length:354 start_codon:yes stop_codon:yes gene_type:complete